MIKEHEEIISETEKYIVDIKPDTQIEELLKNIETNKEATVKIYKGENEISDSKEKLATGMRMETTLGEEKIIHTVIITGDATGDGNSDLQDMIRINTYRLFGNATNLEWMYQKAADVNQDGKIDLQDMIKINAFRLFGIKF